MPNQPFTTLSFILFSLFMQPVFAQDAVSLDSDDKKFSYAIGSLIGAQLIQQFQNQDGIDVDILVAGLSTIVAGKPPLLSPEEVEEIMQRRQQAQLAEAEAAAKTKIAQGLAYLETNQARDGVTVTESGLQYAVVNSGDDNGASPNASDTVVVHYQGTLVDGTVFDSSYARGEPVTFALGSIIPGWQEVLQLMKPGDKWAVVLPSELAYGERGAGQSIGPNETLLFDIELLEVKQSGN